MVLLVNRALCQHPPPALVEITPISKHEKNPTTFTSSFFSDLSMEIRKADVDKMYSLPELSPNTVYGLQEYFPSTIYDSAEHHGKKLICFIDATSKSVLQFMSI